VGCVEHTPEEAAKMRALSESRMKAEGNASKSDKGGNPTTEITLWLDVEVIDKFKSSGDGWQTRINDALKNWVQTHAL
jgi:uncharacterized protein (DUF4415 family)